MHLHKITEKVAVHDPSVGTERVVNVTVELDLKALAERALNLKLVLEQGQITVKVKKLGRG